MLLNLRIMVFCSLSWHPSYFRFSCYWKTSQSKTAIKLSSATKPALFITNFQSFIVKTACTGQVLDTKLGKSLRSKLTSARQAENWLKYLSSFGYAIAFDDGRHITIHFCCLSTLQTDPRKGGSDDQFFLTRSSWDPVQLGTKKCLVMWWSFSSGGWRWGNTN